MRRLLILLLLSIFSLIAPSLSYGSGAPSVACEKMIPDHGPPPQTSPSPYKVVLNKKMLSVHEPLEITLTSKSGQDIFVGFLVQVRMNLTGQPEKPYGGFVEGDDDNARLLACSNIPDNAMTHNSNKPKKVVKVHWMPQMPGKYRVYTTFAKDKNTYWTNVPHYETIEVMETDEDYDAFFSMKYDWNTLCSNMKLNESVPPVTGTENPYEIMIEHVKMPGGGKEDHRSDHKIHQKGLLNITVTSPLGTSIMKLFMQVRRKREDKSKAFGKFIVDKIGHMATPGMEKFSYELVDCFGGKQNALLFMNLGHRIEKISDFSVKWEAPESETGNFEVVATILSEEDTFWDKVGEEKDVEARTITVVKGTASTAATSTPGKTDKGKKKNSGSQVSNSVFGVTLPAILFLVYTLKL